MTTKKLQLQILDPTGEVVVTHHFYFKAGEGNRLRLTITDNTYIMDKDGKLVILTQKEIDDEEKLKRIDICKCCGKPMKARNDPEYLCMNPYCDNYIKINKFKTNE